MNIKIKNFAVIGDADVTVDGLSVIAGPNGSGKSTVGKLFYSVINAVHKTETEYVREKTKRIRNVFEHTEDFSLQNFFAVQKRDESREKAARITESNDASAFQNELSNEALLKINKILSVSRDDFFKACAEKLFKYEFGYQLLNVNNMEPAVLDYDEGNGRRVNVHILNNTRTEAAFSCAKDNRPSIEAFYIDTPYIMDESGFGLHHRRDLKRKLFADTDNLAQKVFGRLFTDIGGGETVNITNVSAGFKTVLMLKSMYAKGMLANGNLLVLDEPEIHLHPDLQITLAEILVTLVKSGKIRVLVNTHSPYFLEAIEVFAEKMKIEKMCRYYLTNESGTASRITETTGNVENIYKLLAEPFEKLEKLRNDFI